MTSAIAKRIYRDNLDAVSAALIAGRHRAEARAADGSEITPYMNHSVIMLMDGRWKGIWLQAIMENTELQILSPDIAAARAEARRILERSGR